MQNNVPLPVWWVEFKEEPHDGEKGGPPDVTTPPGQSMDLPLVLANDRATNDRATSTEVHVIVSDHTLIFQSMELQTIRIFHLIYL